jgi:hypothetical protein
VGGAARELNETLCLPGLCHGTALVPTERTRYQIGSIGYEGGGTRARCARRLEGKNVAVEYRWAEGNYARLPEMAQDLVGRNVLVIFTGGGVASAPIAKAATDKIPIVFASGNDPIADGLVKSMARPEGNITGVSFSTQMLGAKRLGFLNLLAPSVTDVAVVVNPNNPSVKTGLDEIQAAARSSKRTVPIFEARTTHEIDLVFDAISRQRVEAILIHSDPLFTCSTSYARHTNSLRSWSFGPRRRSRTRRRSSGSTGGRRGNEPQHHREIPPGRSPCAGAADRH